MLKQINYVMNKRQKRNMVILFLMILLGSFIELIGVAGISPIVTIITDESVVTTNNLYIMLGDIFHLTNPRQYVGFLSVALIAVYIIKNAYIILENNMQYRFSYNNRRRLARELLTYYAHKEYLFHVNTNVADLKRNVETDVFQFWGAVLCMMEFSMELLVCVVLMVYLLISDWQSTLAVVAILGLFLAFFSFFFRRYSTRLGVQCRELYSIMTKTLLQIFAGIKEIKVSNKESFFVDKYDKAIEQYCISQRKQDISTLLPKPIMESVCVCGLLLVMTVRICQGTDMKEFIPILSVFVVAAYRMMPSFNRITAYYGSIMYSKASVNNVYNDIKRKREYEKQQVTVEQDAYEFNFRTDIEVKNISFAYPNNEKKILDKVSFVVPAKQSVAFVGPSGAGKSTMADIILGVLVPQEGQIVVEGVNIYEHIESWHDKIGYIPQVIYLLDDSIRNNVAFGIDTDKIDDERIWVVLKEAQMDEFVRNLPNGLDTGVGDRGVRLSGGQRQRIGIARALYNNPELLVLDEATSALDNDTEKAVMEAIDELHGSHTMIIIAHRLSTIKNCDIIYKIENGQVTAEDKEIYIYK
jgi:ABC-type multidrug transport system fused ATPase/permease subunit